MGGTETLVVRPLKKIFLCVSSLMYDLRAMRELRGTGFIELTVGEHFFIQHYLNYGYRGYQGLLIVDFVWDYACYSPNIVNLKIL